MAFCGLQDQDLGLARVGMDSAVRILEVANNYSMTLILPGPHSRAVFMDRKFDGMNSPKAVQA